MKNSIRKGIAILGLCLCLDGCIPTAVATYAVTRHRTRSQYRAYVADMEKTNQERKDKGLEPMPIKSFEDWKHTN
jgi:hypothetical protein